MTTLAKSQIKQDKQQEQQHQQEEFKPIAIPDDIQRILNANYEVAKFSDDEENDIPDELVLQNVQKPIIAQQQDLPPTKQEEDLINNTTIEDYLKNTLSQLNMVKTLNQFQSEFQELNKNNNNKQRLSQLTKTNNLLLQENLKLKFQLDQLSVTNNKIEAAATQAKDQFIKLRKQRDFHRTKHRQVVQEKQVLINDLRRLREHCQLYQPLIMELNSRYDKLLRSKQLSDIARDKAQNELKKIQINLLKDDTQVVQQQNEKQQTTLNQTSQNVPQQHFKPTQIENPFLQNTEVLKPSKFTVFSQLNKVHDGAISSVFFHKTHNVTATASSDGSFKILTNYDASQPNTLLIRGQPHNSFVTSAKFNPNINYQSILASCAGDGSAKLFNIAKQAELCTLKTLSTIQSWALDWHVDGRVLAIGSSDKAVRLYDINVNQALLDFDNNQNFQAGHYSSLRGCGRAVTSVGFQPFGNMLTVSSADGTTRIYDPRQNTLVNMIQQKNASKSVFDLTGNYVACGDLDGSLLIHDLRTSKPLYKLQAEEGITGLSFGSSVDNMVLATKKGLFSVQDKYIKAIGRTETFAFECCDYNPTNGGFAAGTSDGTLVFVV